MSTPLPPELLLEVFAHLESVDPREPKGPEHPSLKAASLVCRAWRDPAQTTLWHLGAALDGQGEVEQWIKTRSRRRQGPKELLIYDVKDDEVLKRLWNEVHGIERLSVVSPVTRMSASTFDHPALADVTDLILYAELEPSDPTTTLRFRLRRLVVADSGLQTRHQASFISSLSRNREWASDMKYLSLSTVAASAHRAVAESILPFAGPNLLHLGLSIGRHHDATPYVDVLRSATRLRSFECTSLPVPLLVNLPTSLRGLATKEEPRSIPIREFSKALERLTRIDRLYISCLRKEFEALEGAEQLVEKMEKRGIERHFSEDY
ncbi:hypothetical protein JCM10212_001929 [Sporobolomyces blumeae]